MALSKSLYQNSYQNILVYFRYFRNTGYIRSIETSRFRKKNEQYDRKWMFSENEVLKAKAASEYMFSSWKKILQFYGTKLYTLFLCTATATRGDGFSNNRAFFFAIFLLVLTRLSNNFYFYTVTDVHFSRFPKAPYSTFPICHHLLLFSMYFLCDHINT